MEYSIIPAPIHAEILLRLHKIEKENDVRIVLAVESGSRAWGFASPNSDFDVRFIYVRPRNWYLSINVEDQRDVIDYGIADDIDLNGWDVRKALQLFWKCNPTFVEWLQSPIRYIDQNGFAAAAQNLLPQIYAWEKGLYHYRSTAKTNYREYLRGDEVRLKKYFYVLRPLLAARWLETFHTPAPIEFDRLLPMLGEDEYLLADIQALVIRKQASAELAMGATLPRLNKFIEAELVRLEKFAHHPVERPGGMGLLNELFIEMLSKSFISI